MPIVLAAIGWGLSWSWQSGRWLDWKKIISAAVPILFVGGMVVGALQPTNTWDYITFTVFNIIALGYVSWRKLPAIKGEKLPKLLRKAILPALGVLIFIGSSRLLYYQFNHNFFPGYSTVGFWEGPKTPIWCLSAAGADPLPDRVVVRMGAVPVAGNNQVVTTTRMVEKHFLIGFAAGIGTLFSLC